MRQLAQFPSKQPAETLAAALFVEEIDCRVDEAKDGSFLLWVIDEKRLDDAKALLALFESNPADPRFEAAKGRAAERRRSARKEEKRRTRTVSFRQRWSGGGDVGLGPVTFLLIGVSTLLFMFTFPGVPESIGTTREKILEWIWFERNVRMFEPALGYFSDIGSGQLWRLISPIFAHAEPDFSRGVVVGILGFAHFLFNMWWLKDFGSQIESRQGAWFMLALVLGTAVFSNTAQYLVSGGRFLGMSGVVYALFGYLWVRGKVDPFSGYGLSSGTVSILLLWFAFGFVGSMSIATWAHAGGLASGALLGWVLGLWAQRRPR